MKHIKLFENINISHIKSTINEYYNFIELTTPIIFEKYDELAKDENYEPEWGETPHDKIDKNSFTLDKVVIQDNSIFTFIIHEFSDDGEVYAKYFIDMTEDELEQKIFSKKYNL